MTAVYTVSKPCGCTLMRTIDRREAVEYARAHSLILDAITCRTEAAERKVLTGDIVLACECNSSTTGCSFVGANQEPTPSRKD
jgi:hypothetical protein